MKYLAIVTTFFLFFMGSCKTRESSSSAKIIPSVAAIDGQFVGVVFFNGCSAVKVGAKHFLTSARCVVDEATKKLKSGFKQNAKIDIFSGVLLGKSIAFGKVKTTFVHHSFMSKLLQMTAELTMEDLVDVADVAMVVVAQDTPEIGTAQLAAATIRAGQKVVVTGYGLNQDPSAGASLIGDEAEESDLALGALSWLDIPAGEVKKQMLTIASRPQGSNEIFVKILEDDRGAPVYLDDSATKPPKEHKFLNLVAIVSGSDAVKGLSYFSRLDEEAAIATCIKETVSKNFDKVQSNRDGSVSNWCGS